VEPLSKVWYKTLVARADGAVRARAGARVYHVFLQVRLQTCDDINAFVRSKEQVPGVADAPAAGPGIESALYDVFRRTDTPALYLVVHTLDARARRDAKPSALLATIALRPCTHLVASVGSVHAPLLWSAAEVAARTRTGTIGWDVDVPCAWVSHNLTRFVPYEEEIRGLPRA